MLRGIGLALIVFGALGVFAALQAIAYRLLGKSSDFGLSGGVYSGVFAACGMAAGILLVRRKLADRGPLFWIALFGICLTAPLAVMHIVFCIFYAFQDGNILAFIQRLFLSRGIGDGWWPPHEVLFLDTLMFGTPFGESLLWYGRPLHEPLLVIRSIANSTVLWTYLPLALCIRGMSARPGTSADKFFALFASLLAALLMTSAVESAWVYYQQVTYEPSPTDAINYLYQPRLSWFAFYAIAILSLVAVAILLLRRRANRDSLSTAPVL